MCCLQVQNIHSFRGEQNGRIFTFFHQVYLHFPPKAILSSVLECKKCHIENVGKAETDFNLRLIIT